jgi:hypothetical protein
MFGKWHLGMHQEKYYPTGRGFDIFQGYLQGAIQRTHAHMGSGHAHTIAHGHAPSLSHT